MATKSSKSGFPDSLPIQLQRKTYVANLSTRPRSSQSISFHVSAGSGQDAKSASGRFSRFPTARAQTNEEVGSGKTTRDWLLWKLRLNRRRSANDGPSRCSARTALAGGTGRAVTISFTASSQIPS